MWQQNFNESHDHGFTQLHLTATHASLVRLESSFTRHLADTVLCTARPSYCLHNPPSQKEKKALQAHPDASAEKGDLRLYPRAAVTAHNLLQTDPKSTRPIKWLRARKRLACSITNQSPTTENSSPMALSHLTPFARKTLVSQWLTLRTFLRFIIMTARAGVLTPASPPHRC